MNDPHVLTIDCGTQSIRALVFDAKGNLVVKEKEEFNPYIALKPGWAEQHPEVYWKGLCNVCNRVKELHHEHWKKIIAVTVTTLRDSCVNLDKDGNVLRPIILWLDQRMAECKDSIPIQYQLLFKAIKMDEAVKLATRKTKSNWIRENEPEIWAKTHNYLLLSGYLNFKLTDNMVDSVAAQIGHIPFDYKKKEWYSKHHYKWSIFSIEKEKLPQLVEPGEVIGQITKKASQATGIKEGIPLIATGSDKGCETLGSGCKDIECGSISFGTTSTIQTTSKKYFEPLQFLPAYPAVMPGYYNPEVEIFRGYWMISWFKKEFSVKEMLEAAEKKIPPEELLNQRLNEVPPGSYGLILQPYWGPGLKNPEAKGAIIGFGDVHTRSHIYRAIIEGINFALMDGLECIEKKSGEKVKKITVSGGGSQSDAICQITADMFNRPVFRAQTYETSGLGSSIVAFVSMGVYKDFEEAIKNMVRYNNVFYPNKEVGKIYDELYNKIYKRIYPSLRKLYHEIKSISNYPDY